MEELSRIKIEGFRSIRMLDLELTNLTVLVGANGSGKSNFLSFFRMISYLAAGRLQLYLARSGGGSSILNYGPRQTPMLQASLRFDGDADSVSYEFDLEFAAPDILLFSSETVTAISTNTTGIDKHPLGAGHLESKLLDFPRHENQTLGAGLTAHRLAERLDDIQVYHFHDTSHDSAMRISQEIGRNRYLLSDGGNLAAFLYMLRETKPQHYSRIVSTVRLAVPYLTDFVLEPERLNSSRIQLRWRDRNPEHEFSAHQLSDGSLRAIALITALLQPEDMMSGMIMIDEPELGLHPSAVGLIGSLIKAASSTRQVVIATQSPRLISEFAPDDLVVVEREEDDRGDGQSVFRRLSHAELGTWLDDYSLGTLYEMEVTGGGPQ